ncbi:MAG: T9SS type A sorting domain-containing protein [Fibrobacter sp.]|nr:T9SS type A sorting domain-containing protein [Fibrobacter sp.]
MNYKNILLCLTMLFSAAFADISTSPITPNATVEAQKLYKFLLENYGERTIAGVQTGDLAKNATLLELEDMLAVKNAGDKFPALVGFDFQFSIGKESGGSWHQEYTTHTLSLIKETWELGGIPAITWHWRDPSHEVDAFYTPGTGNPPHVSFDFSDGFISNSLNWNKDSETYKNLIRDIDKMAEYFLTLQEQGVAAIFRPLHECGGTWFWWSVKSGSQYAELYRLVFDRMVHEKGVKNMIWVWNPEKSIFTDPTWNPGNNYHDVIAVDIYNDPFDYQTNHEAFIGMKNNYGTNKIFTLAENGPIPDVNLMRDQDFMWSWFMPWYESWGSEFVSKTSPEMWTETLNSPYVYSLDKMPGWENYALDPDEPSVSIYAETKPINYITLNGNKLHLSFKTSGNYSIELLNIQGKKLNTLHKGYLEAGNQVINILQPTGIYFIAIKGSKHYNHKILVP